MTPSDSKLRVLLLGKLHETSDASLEPGARAAKALGALCLKSYVEAQEDLAHRVDLRIRTVPKDTPMSKLLGLVLDHRPDLLGLTCQVWSHQDMVRLSVLVRAALPDTIVVHGGPMVTHRGRYLRALGPDTLNLAVQGYGEVTFARLLRRVLDGPPGFGAIPGVAWFDESGRPRVNRTAPPPGLSDMPPVVTPEALEHMGPYALYETARGCPYGCKFCNWGTHRIQFRPPEVIERDLAALLAHPGVRTIWIVDSAIDMRRSHARLLAEIIRRHRKDDTRVVGYLFLKARDLSFVRDLVGAFDTLQLGLQTADAQLLSELGRGGLAVERFDAMFEAVLPHFPGLRVDLMFGLPGMTLETLQGSLRALLERGIRFVNIFRLVAIPGTEMGDNQGRYGILAERWPPYEVYAASGVDVQQMHQMARFKEATDLLRPVLATGCYPSAKARGVDLVDFAASLPKTSPSLLDAVSFQDEHDAVLDPDLVELVLAAARRYTAGSPHRRDLLLRLLREGYGLQRASQDGQGTPDAASSVPTGERDALQSGAGQRNPTGALLRLEEDSAWWIRVERATSGRRYFGAVEGLGIYYGWDGERRPPGEDEVQRRLDELLGRLRREGLGGLSLDRQRDMARAVARVASLLKR